MAFSINATNTLPLKMKTYPVYFYGKLVCQWNPLTETLMEVLRVELIKYNHSTYENTDF